MQLRFAFAALALGLALGSASVRAQDAEDVAPEEGERTPDELAREEARNLFMAAAAAAESGRWADAITGFERAYQLTGSASALYNAAMAMRAAGRHVEARDAFQRIVRDHADTDIVDEARSLRDEAAARIATIELTGLRAELEYAIRLDGRSQATGETRFDVDAGEHALTARAEGFQQFAWEGVLAEGQHELVRVILEPIETRTVRVEGTPITKSWVFWTVLGALVLGGAAVGIYFWDQSAQLDPDSENVVRLRAPAN